MHRNTMIEVLPAILADTADDLREKLFFPGLWQPGMTAHVDILDGTMFGATCFCDAMAVHSSETTRWVVSTVPFIELHCMVQNPLPIITQWAAMIPETIRAIVHAEIERPVEPILQGIHDLALEAGIALCPETSADTVDRYRANIDRVLVMGIHPGASGKPFLNEPILANIRRIRAVHPDLVIAVDGGITADVAQRVVRAGANALIASSAIWNSPRPIQAYEQLTHSTALPANPQI
jgi:ribulose-phosphate 3-epimerase